MRVELTWLPLLFFIVAFLMDKIREVDRGVAKLSYTTFAHLEFVVIRYLDKI